VLSGFRECFERASGPLVVDVAQGNDVGAQPADGGDVAGPHAAGADPGDVDTVAGRDETRPAENMARDNGEAPGESRRHAEENTSRAIDRTRSIIGCM